MNKNLQNLQELLIAAGYDVGPYGPDGKLGKYTNIAIALALKDGFTIDNYTLIPPKKNIKKEPENKSKGFFDWIGDIFGRDTSEPWTPESVEGSVLNGAAYMYDTDSKTWVPTQACAAWANSALRNYKTAKGKNIFGYSEIGGDAWTRLGNGKGSKMIFSGYEGTTYDPTKYSAEASNKRNWAAADRVLKEFDSKTLDKNKVYLVNMYYKNSEFRKKAWENATAGTTGTHTGNLYWNPLTNSWRVVHNVHGKIIDDDFIAIQGGHKKYGVTAIAEPARRAKHGAKLIKKAHDGMEMALLNPLLSTYLGTLAATTRPSATVTATRTNYAPTKIGQDFITALNNNRAMLMQRYNLSDSDYADMVKFAVNIAQRESRLGNSNSYKLKTNLPDSAVQLGKRIVRGNAITVLSNNPYGGTGAYWQLAEPTSLSRGLTQIKYLDDIKNDPWLKKEYDALGITELGLASDPDLMAKATIARIIRGDQYLREKNEGKPFHYKDGSEIDHNSARAIWWNRGGLTDGINEPPSNTEAGGVAGYVRRYEHLAPIK